MIKMSFHFFSLFYNDLLEFFCNFHGHVMFLNKIHVYTLVYHCLIDGNTILECLW